MGKEGQAPIFCHSRLSPYPFGLAASFGLAIVKELIEAQGGLLGADSSGDETRVWFTLPG